MFPRFCAVPVDSFLDCRVEFFTFSPPFFLLLFFPVTCSLPFFSSGGCVSRLSFLEPWSGLFERNPSVTFRQPGKFPQNFLCSESSSEVRSKMPPPELRPFFFVDLPVALSIFIDLLSGVHRIIPRSLPPLPTSLITCLGLSPCRNFASYPYKVF